MHSYKGPLKELTLKNDACEYGLGAALIQEEQPVAYASRSLSDTEKRYAHGRKVNVFTDHKPLVSIFQKPQVKAPKRLQNLQLRAQQYDFSIKYKPGKEIPLADALSRAPTDKPEAEELMIVNNLTMHPIKDRRLSETLRTPSWKHKPRLLLQAGPETKDYCQIH